MGDEIEFVEYSDKLCFKCLKEHNHIHKYNIDNRGYGSDFDTCYHELQVCNECDKDEFKIWFDENPIYTDYWEEYKNEKNIADFINDELTLQGQELFWNQTSRNYNIDSQDWIDIELKIAPDSTYKKYGYYSPSEIKAYKERFPTCVHTYVKIHADGSGGSRCKYKMGVFGERDGSCSNNISSGCYYCDMYEKRDYEEMNIEEVKHTTFKIVEMLEMFCPTCGNRIMLFKDKVISDYAEDAYCDKCNQEIYFDIDSILEQ